MDLEDDSLPITIPPSESELSFEETRTEVEMLAHENARESIVSELRHEEILETFELWTTNLSENLLKMEQNLSERLSTLETTVKDQTQEIANLKEKLSKVSPQSTLSPSENGPTPQPTPTPTPEPEVPNPRPLPPVEDVEDHPAPATKPKNRLVRI